MDGRGSRRPPSLFELGLSRSAATSAIDNLSQSSPRRDHAGRGLHAGLSSDFSFYLRPSLAGCTLGTREGFPPTLSLVNHEIKSAKGPSTGFHEAD